MQAAAVSSFLEDGVFDRFWTEENCSNKQNILFKITKTSGMKNKSYTAEYQNGEERNYIPIKVHYWGIT